MIDVTTPLRANSANVHSLARVSLVGVVASFGRNVTDLTFAWSGWAEAAAARTGAGLGGLTTRATSSRNLGTSTSQGPLFSAALSFPV